MSHSAGGCLSQFQVTRNKRMVFEGPVNSLRRIKENVKEVTQGLECGLGVAGFSDWEVGDVIQASFLIPIPRKVAFFPLCFGRIPWSCVSVGKRWDC